MLPPAPGRFSTGTGCFQISERRCETVRQTMSTAPPAGKGITMLTGLAGQVCGYALPQTAISEAPITTRFMSLFQAQLEALAQVHVFRNLGAQVGAELLRRHR